MYAKWILSPSSFMYKDRVFNAGEVIPEHFKNYEPLNYYKSVNTIDTRKWVDYTNKKIFYLEFI